MKKTGFGRSGEPGPFFRPVCGNRPDHRSPEAPWLQQHVLGATPAQAVAQEGPSRTPRYCLDARTMGRGVAGTHGGCTRWVREAGGVSGGLIGLAFPEIRPNQFLWLRVSWLPFFWSLPGHRSVTVSPLMTLCCQPRVKARPLHDAGLSASRFRLVSFGLCRPPPSCCMQEAAAGPWHD